jgi:hypothetical protein
MGKKRLPDLPETGRIYVDRTRGGWLASPGIERHVVARRRTPVALIAVVILAVLALLLYWRL